MVGETRGVGLVYRPNRRNAPLWVTVVDDQAEERVRGLLDQYPALESVCRFIESSMSVRDLHRLDAVQAERERPPSRAPT